MATKNRISGKRREEQEEERTPNHQGEEQSDEETDSDSDSAAAPLVPPKKPKFIRPLEPEPEENGSACSSPSASGFIIMPAVKPCGDKKKRASASKVFGNDDVITLLERLSDFWVNGKNNKWAEFHLFVKDDLRNHFTKIQVSEKIRSLKKRFLTISERDRANGGSHDLSDPHELVVFELSKALWGDEISTAPEKGQIAESNVDEEADEITRETKVVSENEEGSNNVKKRKQVFENGEGSKSTKKRKQLGEHGKGSKKARKQEHGIRKLLDEEEEGDLRDAAITIMSIRNQVGKNGEGNEETRKGEQVNELDDKELPKEGIQVDELDDKELPKEGIQVDELDDKELPEEGIQVNGHDEAAKIPSKKKRGDEYDERKRKMKKRKAKERDEAKKTARAQKEVDEHVGKKESLKEVNQHDEDDELMNEGKQADEYDEQNVTTRKKKQVDGHEVNKDFAKQGKQVDGDHEEENIPAIQKQTKISAEEFQSSYPLLWASFDIYGYPMFTKEICLMIGQENLQELERKWWEINDEAHHLGLKKLQLMKRDFNGRLQGKC